ncbi:MAG: hypothetical protein AAF430_16980 [Myxococcota bacterium]
MSHPVLAGLASEDAAARAAACDAARQDPAAILFVDALVATLSDPDRRVCRAASAALVEIGRDDDQVLSRLRTVIHDSAPAARLEAAWVWARLEPPPIQLLPPIVTALDTARGDRRWRAARLLVELGRLHAEVLPVVESLLGPEHPPRVRRIALTALRALAPAAPATLERTLEASRDPDAGLRRLALATLPALAGPAEAPESLWLRCLEGAEHEADATTRRAASRALDALGAPPAHLHERVARVRRANAQERPASTRLREEESVHGEGAWAE